MPGSLQNIFRKAARAVNPAPAQTAAKLREMILKTRPDQIGASPSAATPNVWGVLMEWWMGDTLVTVVSLVDGSTSMYFSTGGGFIGAGQQPKPAEASRHFVREAENVHGQVAQVAAIGQPRPGYVAFHLLTFDGYRSIQMGEGDAWLEANPFRALRAAGEEVVTQIRIQSEK